jgi:hypothetical protein
MEGGMLSDPFGAMQIFENIHLTVLFEDWSSVRSPSRARRRMQRGFKQRIRYLHIPDPNVYRVGSALHMHPETARKLRAEIANGEPRP